MACIVMYHTVDDEKGLVGVFNCPLTQSQEERWLNINIPDLDYEDVTITSYEWDGYISRTP